MWKRKETSCGERLQTPTNGANATRQFSTAQTMFRSFAQGRWQADAQAGTRVPVTHFKVYPGGVVDVIGLDYDARSDSYIRQSSGMPRDFAVGRPY